MPQCGDTTDEFQILPSDLHNDMYESTWAGEVTATLPICVTGDPSTGPSQTMVHKVTTVPTSLRPALS